MEIFSAILGSLSSLITEPIKGWQARKTLAVEQEFEIQKLEHEAKVAIATSQLEMAKQGQQIDFNLDQMSMTEMAHSWKDEFILLVFITPMILSFVPAAQEYALKGFETIEKMPEWYRYIIIGMVIVIYGMRGLLKTVLEFKNPFKGN